MVFGSSHLVRLARNTPLLTRDQETILAARWKDRGDAAARERLFVSHLRLVVSAASRMKSYASRFDDLMSEGSLGLLDAIDRFDPACGARLATYCPIWIRARMNEFVRRSTGVVCLPASGDFKKASSRMGEALKRAGCTTGEASGRHVALAAADIGVPEHVAMAVVSRNRGQVSLDAPAGDGEGATLVGLLPSGEATPAGRLDEARRVDWASSVVSRCLSRLSDRERAIYVSREMSEEQASLDDLAAEYGVSRQRINQIQHAARAKMTASAGEYRALASIHLAS